MKFAISLCVLLGLGASVGCKSKKKEEEKPKDTAAPSDPTGDSNPEDDRSGDGDEDENRSPEEAGDVDKAKADWTDKVTGKTWRICRKYSSTDSELVAIAFRKGENGYTRAATTYGSGDCKGSAKGPAANDNGIIVVTGPGSEPDTWKFTNNYNSTVAYNLAKLSDGKLYFCSFDSNNRRETEAKRCTSTDDSEPHTSSGEPIVVTATTR